MQVSALCVAALLLGTSAAPRPGSGARTDTYKQSAQATLDFLAHEQSSGQAQVAPAPAAAPTPLPPRAQTAPSAPRRPSAPSDTQQHLPADYRPRPSTTSAPKRDWELVPPSTQRPTTTTARTYARPTPPSYAGVVKNSGGRDRQEVVLPTLPPLTTQRPRVYNIPIVVEGRGDYYTTTTESGKWYDKLFGRGTDVDDSPWGRRRREADLRTGVPREDVVVGSSAIRVVGKRPQQQKQRPSAVSGQ